MDVNRYPARVFIAQEMILSLYNALLVLLPSGKL